MMALREVQEYLATLVARVAYSDESWEDLRVTATEKWGTAEDGDYRELRPSLVDPSTSKFLDGVG